MLVEPDVTVLALGGASWPKLGSDARWAAMLRAQEIAVTPLRPANCGFIAAWSEVFRRFEGQPLKRIAIAFAGRSVRGEAMITRDGLEGGAIYALSSAVARGDRAQRPSDDHNRSAAGCRRGEARRTAVGAARQAIAVEFSAQGDPSVAGGPRARS